MGHDPSFCLKHGALMAFRDELSPKACKSLLLPDAVLPIHALVTADVGGPCFWVEQRYWTNSVGVPDSVKFRTKETQRDVLGKLRKEFTLDDASHDIVDAEGSREHLTLLLSIRALLCWLTTHWLMALHNQAGFVGAPAWRRCVRGFFEAATNQLFA